MSAGVVLQTVSLGLHWPTIDPFLFCAHHNDFYPAGNEHMGPAASLAGRNIGMDFEGKDGWRMYHGDVVPGFPRHPHRGFETVTLARHGLLDHADSLGATARFGHGDVQWMTAGKGIVHSEMFPLLERDGPNHAELFQVWLNLPRRDKMVDPHFAMLWGETIPRLEHRDDQGRVTLVTIVAGSLAGAAAPPAPPPNSWAAKAESDVAIWTIKMAPGATWTLPAAQPGTRRMLYLFRGERVDLGGDELAGYVGARIDADKAPLMRNGAEEAELLLLQGRPLEEPIAQHGPFVMNTRDEIMQAFSDYRRTEFGGWPWPAEGHVHARDKGRFAVHADGRLDVPAGGGATPGTAARR